MNKKRNVLLIIVIVILAFLAFQRPFFHSFGGHHFIGTYNRECREDFMDPVDNGFLRIDEAMSHVDDGMKEVDKAIARIDEEIKGVDFSISNLDQSENIYYGGYLKNEFPYPIIFHFDTPFVLFFGENCVKVVNNEVFYPKSLKDKLDIKALDSTNSVNVYLESKTIQTTKIGYFTRKTFKYTQKVNYHVSYPFTKNNHEWTVVKDTGSFITKCKFTFGLPSKRNMNYEIEKVKRLNVVNKMVTQIRSTLNKETII